MDTSHNERTRILAELAGLCVDPADSHSLTSFVQRRATSLQQLGAIDAQWPPAEQQLLHAALAAGESALCFAQARRQTLARELTAFKAGRRAAKQSLDSLPPRWRRTL